MNDQLTTPDLADIEEIVSGVVAKSMLKFLAGIGILLIIQLGTAVWTVSNLSTRIEHIENTRNTTADGIRRDAALLASENQVNVIKDNITELVTRQRSVENKLGIVQHQVSEMTAVLKEIKREISIQ